MTGCIGIAHYSVNVRPLAVEVNQLGEWTPGSQQVDLVCPRHSGDSVAFVGLLASKTPTSDISYEWFLADLRGQPVNFNCAGESRYIGFPYVPFVSMTPNPAASKDRHIFLRVNGSELLYRIAVVGKSASVTYTNLASARASAPPWLFEPPPKLTSPEQTEQFLKHAERRFEYYRTISWFKSDTVEVADIKTGGDGDILFIKLGVKREKSRVTD